MASVDDIEMICEKFDQFHDIYEQDYKSVTMEDILNIFKCCLYVEKVASKLEAKDCLNDILTILNMWQKKRDKCKKYKPEVYLSACSHCLGRMLKSKMNIKNVEIAIRIYSTMQPVEIFQDLLRKLMKEEISYKSLNKFALSCTDIDVYTATITLSIWCYYYEIGLRDDLNQILDYKLTDNKLNNILRMQLTVLSLDSKNDVEVHIKSLLYEKLVEHMQMRNLLMENFWMILIFEIDTQILSKVLIKYTILLDLVLKFVNNIASMMIFKSSNKCIRWTPNPEALCPRITYDNLINFLRSFLTEDRSLNLSIRRFLDDNKRNVTDVINMRNVIWTDIYNDVFL